MPWLLMFCLLLSSTGATAGDVDSLRIRNQTDYWQTGGFEPLIPSIHPPTTHNSDDLIQVWLYVPPGGRIDAKPLPEQGRHTLIFPPGTVADRVEYYWLGEGEPDPVNYAPISPDHAGSNRWTVADVRGTRILPDGTQHFHVYRPVNGEPHADLKGWTWPRDDDAAQARATELLKAHVRDSTRPVHRSPMSPSGVRSLARLNHCARCHVPNRPRIETAAKDDRPVERATDAMGFIVPNAVLSDDCVVADHRAEDLNDEDPFVDVRCGEQPARLHHGEGPTEYYTCANDQMPIGYRATRRALRAGHPYTQAMCDSRRYLYENMTQAARAAFAEAFRACGIGE